jgi:flagellar operon protein
MSNKVNIAQNQHNRTNLPVKSQVNTNSQDFRGVFNQVSNNEGLQFSKHANMRLNNRNITLSNEQLARIEDGVSAAKDKGIKDSLVLVDNIALVVNITNKVVVTALSQNSEQNVFTNIDGAVIV